MKRITTSLISVLFTLSVAASTVLAESATPSASTPATSPARVTVKCPPTLVCLTPEEVGEIDKKLIQLERDVKIAKAKSKRIGFTTGCGPAANIEVIDGKVSFKPALVCGMMFGVRW